MPPTSQCVFGYSGTHSSSSLNKNRIQSCPCVRSFHGVHYFFTKLTGNICYYPSLYVDIINVFWHYVTLFLSLYHFVCLLCVLYFLFSGRCCCRQIVRCKLSCLRFILYLYKYDVTFSLWLVADFDLQLCYELLLRTSIMFLS